MPNPKPAIAQIALFLIVFLGTFSNISAQFAFNGSATSIGYNMFRVTPNALNVKGSFWNTTQINLNNPFDLNFQVTQSPNGADGMAFVLQPNTTTALAAPGHGHQCGYLTHAINGNGGITPSFAVELDIFDNSPFGVADPTYDHIAIHNNADPFSLLFGPVGALPTNADIADGVCRKFRIKWNPVNDSLKVWFAGNLRLAVVYDIVANTFGGNPMVYWGFTGSTGGIGCEQNVFWDFAYPGEDTLICTDNTLPITAGGGGAIYSWSPGTYLSAANIANPILTPPGIPGGIGYNLTVTTASGCVDSDSLYVGWVNPPSANAGLDVAFCEGDSVQIGTAAVAGYTYSWSPTLGLSDPTLAQPWAKPTLSTTYTLTIVNTNNPALCDDVDQVIVTFNPAPIAIAGDDTTICNTECVQIGMAPIPGFAYSWTPAAGLSDPAVANPLACPNASLSYTLTVTDTITLCQSQDQVTFTVNSLPPVNAGNDAAICAGTCAPVGSAPVFGFNYSWSPAAGLSDPAIANPIACPTNTTNYIVTVTDPVSLCQSYDTVIITINPLPAADAGSDVAICLGECAQIGSPILPGFTYLWNNAASLDDPNIAEPTACPGSTQTYIVLMTDQVTLCENWDTVTVTVNPLPVVDAGVDKAVCSGFCDTLGTVGLANLSYSWLPASFLNDPGIPTPVSCPDSTVTYVVVASDTLTGCLNSDTVLIVVNPLPLADAGTDTTLCDGFCTTLGSAPVAGGTYIWSPATGLNNALAANPTACISVSETYVMTLTDTMTACLNTDTVTVSINPLPLANSGSDTAVCEGSCTTIGSISLPGLSYNWSPALGLSNPSISDPVACPAATQVYIMTLTDSVTGCENSDSIEITVNALPIADAGPDQDVCEGSCVTIGTPIVLLYTPNWSPVTDLSDPLDPMPMACPGLTTIYALTLTDSTSGCQTIDSVTVNVLPLPTTNAGADAVICEGECQTIGISPTAGLGYSWSPPTDLDNSFISNPLGCPASTTTYILTVTDTATGCENTDSVTITVNSNPIANAGADIGICEGECQTVGAAPTPGEAYNWSPATGLNFFDISDPIACPITNTSYVLTVTDTASGCFDTDTLIVTVSPQASAAYTFVVSPANGLDVTFTDASTVATGSIVTWNWDFGDGNTATSQNPVHMYTVAGSYTVCLATETNQGCRDTICQTVEVLGISIDENILEENIQIYPNPTSGQVFIKLNSLLHEEGSFRVFNLLGEQVFGLPWQQLSQPVYELNLNDLSSGIYLVEIQIGSAKLVKRILRE